MKTLDKKNATVIAESLISSKPQDFMLGEYSDLAWQTAVYPQTGIESLAYPTLGLAGEAGEVAEKAKKIIRDKNGRMTKTDVEEIAKELGDVLWYVNACARKIGVSLPEIARRNLAKLYSRQERGKLHGKGDNR